MSVLNSFALFHASSFAAYKTAFSDFRALQHSRKTRFDRYVLTRGSGPRRGDILLRRLADTFHNGLGQGQKWSPTQCKIFKAFVDAALPKIYGIEWEEVRVRVMRERSLERENPWALVSMGRRNGKTYVTAGTAAAFLLAIPGISVNIYSVSMRASQLLRSTLNDMIENAFEKGTHARREQYPRIQNNKESLS